MAAQLEQTVLIWMNGQVQTLVRILIKSISAFCALGVDKMSTFSTGRKINKSAKNNIILV
jgi:hypothetical protein